MKRFLSTTKGNFRHTSLKRRNLVLVTLVGFVIFAGWLFPKVISSVIGIIMYPAHVLTVWFNTSTDSLPQYLRAQSDLLDKINELEARLATESGTQLSVRRLREENERLREVLGETVNDNRILARVLSRPNKLPYDLVQIDKGSNDGVLVGASVFVGYDTLIGVVVYSASRYAFVELFTSPGFVSTGYLVGPNIFLPLDGVGGGMSRLRAPQGLTVPIGSPVIIPAVSSGVVGSVVAIQNEPTQPEQFIYVEPPVSMAELLFVTVSKSVFEPGDLGLIEERVREAIRKSLIIEELPDLDSVASTSDQ